MRAVRASIVILALSATVAAPTLRAAHTGGTGRLQGSVAPVGSDPVMVPGPTRQASESHAPATGALVEAWPGGRSKYEVPGARRAPMRPPGPCRIARHAPP